MIRRIGAATEKLELNLTIHSVRVHLDVPCALKVVAKRGKHKSETPELRYHMRTGVVFFEQEIRLPVTLYKRGSAYQIKKIAFRLVRVVGSHCFKDGKGKVNLNEIANTGLSLFKEDIPLKQSLDKHALVCISLSLIKRSTDPESPAQSLKPQSANFTQRLQESRSDLRVNPVRVDCRAEQTTPMTAGVDSTCFSPEIRGSNWSPVSAQMQSIGSQSGSPGYRQWLQEGRERRNSCKTEEDSSPVSPPFQANSFRQASPVLKKSTSLRFDQPEKSLKSPLIKLIKVEESLEEDDHYGQKAASAGTSSSEGEAPNPAAEFRDESLLSDGEEQAKAAQERKRAFRLDLSKPDLLLSRNCAGEKLTKAEEKLAKAVQSMEFPLTSMKTAQPNKQSKETVITDEENRMGVAGMRERGTVCSGCTVQ